MLFGKTQVLIKWSERICGLNKSQILVVINYTPIRQLR